MAYPHDFKEYTTLVFAFDEELFEDRRDALDLCAAAHDHLQSLIPAHSNLWTPEAKKANTNLAFANHELFEILIDARIAAAMISAKPGSPPPYDGGYMKPETVDQWRREWDEAVRLHLLVEESWKDMYDRDGKMMHPADRVPEYRELVRRVVEWNRAFYKVMKMVGSFTDEVDGAIVWRMRGEQGQQEGYGQRGHGQGAYGGMQPEVEEPRQGPGGGSGGGPHQYFI